MFSFASRGISENKKTEGRVRFNVRSEIHSLKTLTAIQLSFRQSAPREGYTYYLRASKIQSYYSPGNFLGRGGSKGEDNKKNDKNSAKILLLKRGRPVEIRQAGRLARLRARSTDKIIKVSRKIYIRTGLRPRAHRLRLSGHPLEYREEKWHKTSLFRLGRHMTVSVASSSPLPVLLPPLPAADILLPSFLALSSKPAKPPARTHSPTHLHPRTFTHATHRTSVVTTTTRQRRPYRPYYYHYYCHHFHQSSDQR